MDNKAQQTENGVTTEVVTEVKVNPLDVCIKDLLSICNEVQDKFTTKNSQQPHWAVCSNKLHTCYIKVEDAEAFRGMFTVFHDKFGDKYGKEIFTYHEDNEDGDVNDEFFKSMEVFPGPFRKGSVTCGTISSTAASTSSKRGGGSSWGKKPVLKGPVIYYTYEDEKAAGVCIPIGEIYRIATTMYEAMEKEGEDDSETRSLPPRLLLAFYKVIQIAHNDNFNYKYEDEIKNNITILEETISDVSVEKPESSSNSGGPFGMLKDVFKKILPTLSKGKDSIIPKEMSSKIEGMLQGSTMDDVGEMFTQISSSIQVGAEKAKANKGKNEVATMLDCISDTIKSEAVANTMTSIAGKLENFNVNGILSPPTETPRAEVSADAGEQS